MTDKRIENINISDEEVIFTPNQLKNEYPLTEAVIHTVEKGQQTVKNILDGNDKRLIAIVGPCSIHDIKAAKEYANKLKGLSEKIEGTIFPIMRVYFEKPRTTVGWQGLINDPYLDNSYKIEDGLRMARELLIYVGNIGLASAGEALDIVTPQYIQDLFSYTAIGARTTESQNHRKLASGLSSAVGFKNGTDGNIKIAVNAVGSARSAHNFVSINPDGDVAVVRTTGNPYAHIILRGGKTPNYNQENIEKIEKELEALCEKQNLIVDCSHANSYKKAENQGTVLEDITKQIQNGNTSIKGFMLESNLSFGNQKIIDPKELKYGVSVTDACIDWDTTERLLLKMNDELKDTFTKS